MLKGVSFNVTLSNEQMEQVASMTADKVLQTRSWVMNNEEILKDEIKTLKQQLKMRDELIVSNELWHKRVQDILSQKSNRLKQYEERFGKLK